MFIHAQNLTDKSSNWDSRRGAGTPQLSFLTDGEEKGQEQNWEISTVNWDPVS